MQMYILFSVLDCKIQFSKVIHQPARGKQNQRSSKKEAHYFDTFLQQISKIEMGSQRTRHSDLLFLVFQKKNHPHVEPLLDTYSNRFHISWLIIENPNMLCFATTKIPYFQEIRGVWSTSNIEDLITNFVDDSTVQTGSCHISILSCRIEKEVCPNSLILADK